MSDEEKYYCGKCGYNHYYSSGIGVDHVEYADIPPEVDEDVRKAEEQGGINEPGEVVGEPGSLSQNEVLTLEPEQVQSISGDGSLSGGSGSPVQPAQDNQSEPQEMTGEQGSLSGESKTLTGEPGSPSQSEALTDDEIVEKVSSDPVLTAIMAEVASVYNEFLQYQSEVEAELDQIVAILEAQAGQGSPGDMMSGLDNLIEKYGLADGVRSLVDEAPGILRQAFGMDPVQSQIGDEYIDRAIELQQEEQVRKNEALDAIVDAIRGGKRVYALSPEDEMAARDAGFIRDEESEETEDE